jgi:DNA-binding NarL/FixJ family response regulator
MAAIALDAPTLADALGDLLPEPLLTAHELEVARLLATGATHAEIAAETGVTPRAIPYTVVRLLQKTRTRTEAQLTRHLIHNGKIN